MRTRQPEPDLGPSKESIENGAEPADALYIDRGFLPDPPEPEDVLDAGPVNAYLRGQLAEALAAARGPEPEPEPELEAG
jgi:hypothetical protein